MIYDVLATHLGKGHIQIFSILVIWRHMKISYFGPIIIELLSDEL